MCWVHTCCVNLGSLKTLDHSFFVNDELYELAILILLFQFSVLFWISYINTACNISMQRALYYTIPYHDKHNCQFSSLMLTHAHIWITVWISNRTIYMIQDTIFIQQSEPMQIRQRHNGNQSITSTRQRLLEPSLFIRVLSKHSN